MNLRGGGRQEAKVFSLETNEVLGLQENKWYVTEDKYRNKNH